MHTGHCKPSAHWRIFCSQDFALGTWMMMRRPARNDISRRTIAMVICPTDNLATGSITICSRQRVLRRHGQCIGSPQEIKETP